MTMLVTGAAGFIGSHVAEALVEEGHEVHILDYEESGTFNVGTSKEVSVNALFRMIRDPLERRLKKPGEQQRSMLRYGGTHRELGWCPEAALPEGIARTVNWFREQHPQTVV